MSKTTKPRKLKLEQKTLRALTDDRLAQVAGGTRTRTTVNFTGACTIGC